MPSTAGRSVGFLELSEPAGDQGYFGTKHLNGFADFGLSTGHEFRMSMPNFLVSTTSSPINSNISQERCTFLSTHTGNRNA